mgnify:CR=1 FL=1
MAITVDVFTKVAESSLKDSSSTIEKHFSNTGEKAGAEFSKALAAGVSKNPEIQKAFDKAADAAGRQRIAQEQLNAVNAKATATDAQKIAYAEKLEKANRDLTRSVNGAADAYEKYHRDSTNALDGVNRSATAAFNVLSNLTSGTRFGGLTSQLANMASGFTTAGVAIDGVGASLLATGAIAGTTVVAGMVAVTAATVALSTELYNLGSEFDSVFDSMAVKTGATGDILSQLQTVVKDVAGQVPESFGTIGDITAQVTQSMRLTVDQTEEVVTALGNLKHMGVDVDVHSLGMAFKALKVDQEDYVYSLGQLLNASQKTGQSVDSIAAAIESNAGALQAFGFTVGETVTLIKEFDEAGMSPDKGIGALSKAFKALTDAGLEPTKENLQKVFDEIKGFADSGQAQRANDELSQLFGPRGGGLTWLPLIQDGTLNLNDLADAAEAPSSNIQELADRTYDLGENFTMLGNQIKAGLEPISSEFFGIINDALTSFAAWFKDNKPEIIGFFTFLSTQVVNFGQQLTGVIGTALYSIGAAGENLPWVGDKFKATKDAGQDLMGYAAKLDVLQGHLQAVGDRANTASRLMRDLGGSAKLSDDGKSIVLDKDVTSQTLAGIDKSQYKLDNLPDGRVKVTAITDEAKEKVQAWVDETNRVPIKMPVSPDVQKGKDEVEQFKKDIEAGRPIQLPIQMAPSGEVTSGGGGHFFAPQGARSGASPRDFAHQSMMPFWQSQGFQVGDHGADKYVEHQNGALDVMVPSIAAGAQVLKQVLSDPNVYGAIFNNQTFGYGHGKTPQDYTAGHTGDPTQDHQDHVHIWYKPGGKNNIAGGGMQHWGPQGGMSANGPGDAGSFDNISPLPVGPTMAPGLAPGPVGSTPGYNEYGEPGYYRPDSKSIRGATRGTEDAEDRVTKANERVKDLNQQISDLQSKRNTLNAEATDKKVADLTKQLDDANKNVTRAQEDRDEAYSRLDEAKRGRFTPAREQGKRGGRSSQLGGDLADDFGLSEGLPGIAKWLTTFAMNMAMAPMLGSLQATAAASPYQGGYGMLGTMGANNMAAGLTPLGLSSGAAYTPGASAIGPAPIGGGMVPGLVPPVGPGAAPAAPGAAAGPSVNSVAPTAGAGGAGFQGVGGLPLAGLQAATAGLDMMAPGAGQAAQTGIQLANRTAGYVGQLAGIGVGGLMETLLPHGSALADPGKSWVGRIASGVAGARPALPNAAGGDNPAGSSAPPQTPEQAQALQAQNGGGQSGGPMVHVENMNNYSSDGGQSISNQIARSQMSSYMSGGPR